MTWDDTMLGALKVYARNNQAVITAPFILAGAMSPVSVAGTLAQTLAEAMSGIAFTQAVNPGAPGIFGSFASSLSMQTGAPTFGTPEPAKVLYGCAKLARRLGVPFRSGGSLTGAKTPDAQAAYESTHTILPTVMGGVNFVLHAGGWMEGGLVADYAKLLLDADQLTMMQNLVDGIDVSENGQAMNALHETGPGQHFLGSSHTQANFETAFWRSEMADNNTFEQWSSEGCIESNARARVRVREMLDSYQEPALDPAIDEALRAVIACRMEELPTPTTDWQTFILKITSPVIWRGFLPQETASLSLKAKPNSARILQPVERIGGKARPADQQEAIFIGGDHCHTGMRQHRLRTLAGDKFFGMQIKRTALGEYRPHVRSLNLQNAERVSDICRGEMLASKIVTDLAPQIALHARLAQQQRLIRAKPNNVPGSG